MAVYGIDRYLRDFFYPGTKSTPFVVDAHLRLIYAAADTGGTAAEITGAGQIASAEAVGIPAIAVTIAAAGITSLEAFGGLSLGAVIAGAGGIATAEALGSPGVGATIAPAGIASAEAFGSPALSVDIVAAGIASAEAFGQPTVVGVWLISGTTRDSGGSALGTCVVHLFRTSDDVEVDQTTSNGSGVYSFTVGDGTTAHYIVAYKAGSPDVAGTTLNTLVGV